MVDVEELITIKVRDFLAQIPAVNDEVRQRMERVVCGDVKYLIEMALDDEVKATLDMIESMGKEITIEVGLFVQDSESS